MEVTQELEAALCAPNWHTSLAHVHNAVQALTTATAEADALRDILAEERELADELRAEVEALRGALDKIEKWCCPVLCENCRTNRETARAALERQP